ncbi:putative glutaminyl-peptide cyclotransferase protein [Lasiodiplodia theobromae]|nr:putative glutaminyl-peptide cyclotransferase protein [Lasiodiplodia theobromae]
MANHGDGWFSSVFDFGAYILDRQPSRKRQGSMFGISAEPDEKPPPRVRALKLLQRKPSHPRKPDSASVEVPIEWDVTREFILYPDGRRGLVKLPLTHLVQRPSHKMVEKIKEGELLDFLAGCKITPAVDIAHEWGLEGSIVLYDPRDPPVFCIEYVYVTDHLREESETRRHVLADPKRNLFFITLRGDDLPTYHFWQDVEKDGDPREAVYWTTYVNGRSPGRVGQQLDDDEIEIVGELHRAREPFDDEEEEDVVQTPKSKDGGLVNGIIDESSGEDSAALDEPAVGEQNKLISVSTPKPPTTSDDELGLTELFGSVYDSDEEFDSDEGSEWDENFGVDSENDVNSDEDAESDEDYMPEGVVLHRGRSSYGFDPSATYYYRCPPGLAERGDRDLGDLIETWEDNLRVRGLASTLQGFSEYQPGGDEIWHFGGGEPPDEPPRRRWPPGRAFDTVAYKLAIASENGGPVQRLIGDEPWTRNDNIGFWNGNYRGMYHPLEDYTPDYHRQPTNVKGMETKRRNMFQPSFNDGEQLSDLVDTRNPWRSGLANIFGDPFPNYLPSPTSEILSPMDFQHDGPNIQPQRGHPSIRDVIITSYDENGNPRDSDYDVVMTDPLHRQRKQSQAQTDPGDREIKLYDGRVKPDALPDPSRPFRVWNWHGFTSNEKDRNEQVMAFWTVVAELIFEGKMGNYVIKLKAYNDDGTEPEDGCMLMTLSMVQTIFENRISEYLSDPARNEVYLVPAPDALEALDRKIEAAIGIPIFTQSGNTTSTLHRLRGSSAAMTISSGAAAAAVLHNNNNNNNNSRNEPAHPPFVPTDCRDCGSCLTSPIAYAAHHIEHFKGRTGSPQELHPEVQQALKRARFRHVCPECGLDLTEASTFGFAMHRRGHEQQRSAARSATKPRQRPSGKRVAFEPAERRRGASRARPNTGATREEVEEEQGLGGRLWELLSGVYSASVERVRSASAPPAPLTSSSSAQADLKNFSSPHVYRGYPRKLFPGPTPPPNSFDESYLKNARSIRPLPYPPRSFPPPAANSFFPRATRATSLPPKSRSSSLLDDDDEDDEGSSIASSLHRRRKGGHNNNHQDGTTNNNNRTEVGGGVKNWFARVFNRDHPTSPPLPPPPSAGLLLSPRTAAARRARLGGEEIITAPHEIEAARAAELRLRDDIDKLRWVHYLLPALQWGAVTQQHLVDRRNEIRLEEMRREAGGGDEGLMAEGWLRRRAREMYDRERGIYSRRKEEEGARATTGGPFNDAELRFKWHQGNFWRLQDFSLVVECRKMRGEESDGKAEFPDWELAWYAERAMERKGPGEYGEEEGKEHHRWRLIQRRERLKKEWARRHPGWDESQETEPYQEGVMPTRWDLGIRRKPVGEPPRRSQHFGPGPGPVVVVRSKPVGSGVGPVLHRRRSPTARYHPYAVEAASPESSPVRRRALWRRVRSREGDDDALAERQLLRHGEIVPLRLSHAIATGQPMAMIEEEWLPTIRRSPNLTRFWVLLIKELERYEQQRAESEEEKRQVRQQTRRRSGVVLGEVANGSDSGE